MVSTRFSPPPGRTTPAHTIAYAAGKNIVFRDITDLPNKPTICVHLRPSAVPTVLLWLYETNPPSPPRLYPWPMRPRASPLRFIHPRRITKRTHRPQRLFMVFPTFRRRCDRTPDNRPAKEQFTCPTRTWTTASRNDAAGTTTRRSRRRP